MASGAGQLNIFVPINKIDEEQRLVYGQAAAEVLDNSGEMFDYDGSKPYFEKWSDNAFATSGGKSHGNIRVMHTSKVAGIVSSPLGFDDSAKTIDCVAKVIDDAEWEMVKAGGYTGFSMGGRYVSRAKKSDGITRYVAEPVEISLVDKPCIPTATFSVVKADGIVEEHRFREDLYKTDIGEASMSVPYAPTNDEILPVAQGLAKAAGQPETAWLDFVEPATAELIAKHAANPAPAAEEPAPVVEAAPVEKADDAHDTGKCDKADCPDCAAAKADNPFADKGKDKGADDGDEAAAAEGEDDEKDKDKKAAKSDFADLQQGWRAKDGTFFVAKADAAAHNDTLTKGAAAPSLADQLETLRKNAAAVLSGEEPVAEGAEGETLKATTLAALSAPLAKFREFADNTLVKGMYSIRRLAEIIGCLDELHCMVACEEAWEDDQTSKLPQMLLDSMKSLGQTLVAMATEEVNEMIASGLAMDTRDGVEEDAPIVIDTVIVELATSTLGLEKAAFETDMRDRLSKRTPPAPVDNPDTLAKVATLTTENEALEKRATAAEGELSKMEPLIKGLQDDMAKILAMPRDKAPTTRVVGKGETIELAPQGGGTGGLDLTKFAPEQIADAAIRLSHQHGRHFILPNGNGGQ